MTVPPILGHVNSLFPHIKKDWWKKLYNETYLLTNGDCVEIPAITEAECNELVRIPCVQQLLQTPESQIKVLDLCCGQGRHSINLAKRFPSVSFRGVDQSSYLLGLAQERAIAEGVQGNTIFQEGDFRHIPEADSSFDLVILLGNSFGHYHDEGDLQSLREVSRVLKPGGIFIIDYVDGSWIRSNFSPSGWEWLEGQKTLIACRERELSPDKTLLATREIVIDLESPRVLQDSFYSVRLYNMEEMDNLLKKVGLRRQAEDGLQLITPTREGTIDMGMMERRQLVVAHKPAESKGANALDEDAGVYVHPNLVQYYDSHKGRSLKVFAPVPAGTTILADVPYALTPSLDPSRPDDLICSNLKCRQRMTQSKESVRCQRNCIRDVAWCNIDCRTADQARHDFECAWLKIQGENLRQNEGEYTFAMIWTILRLLAGRHLELQAGSKPSKLYSWEDRFKRGWESVDLLLGNREQWPQTQIQHWKRLAEQYLAHDIGSDLNLNEMLDLICKEESNSFGLYPGETGIFPIPDPPVGRGSHYGLGIYPRATIFNHSCMPNVTWKPDSNGRMVFTTSRNLAAGEECLICYFDLPKYVDVKTRQSLVQENFLFSCACERCTQELAEEQ
ncbi:uncharacterized protein PGRI_030460 [Penicillium griseofulvum]|uniref:SET domain-containing protein n=1 Tax=Penicillium patulum TaxID=5078 RepID=A0A135LJL9_PENPA|nr:uncharacterized protein PGRI_030460 [Penicillium griseofulvum]KXG49176.1 hypothetical protein PGRI_030460 [Penicillium griseofulvum]